MKTARQQSVEIITSFDITVTNDYLLRNQIANFGPEQNSRWIWDS